MTSREKLGKYSVQELKLAAHSEQKVICRVMWIEHIFNGLKNERMIANLSQLHNSVLQTFHAGFIGAARFASVRVRDEHAILLHLLV